MYGYCKLHANSLSESTNFGFVFGAAERMMSVFNIQALFRMLALKTEKDVKSEREIGICRWKTFVSLSECIGINKRFSFSIGLGGNGIVAAPGR
jgi:hypothetical protein